MPRHISCDVLIVGGGTGGCAAALAASEFGLSVVMTEETDWIGGQLTAQLVPPDEHPSIEARGSTRRYRDFRNRVRAFYRANYRLTLDARQNPLLNPGGGWVSRLCHEPRIGWLVLKEMLQPAISAGNLEILLHTSLIGATTHNSEVTSVSFLDKRTGQEVTIEPKIVLDATETGDLLPLTGAEYRLGAESKAETNEPNAVDGSAQPDNVQGITWCAIVSHDEGSHQVIDRPAGYERWRDYAPESWPGKLLDFTIEDPVSGNPRLLPLFGATPDQKYCLFSYRQIVDPSIFESPREAATVVNWPQNDYFVGTILDVPDEIRVQRLAEARDLTMSLIYWLQTEAPRHDGGTGYPGLYLRPDLTDTEDGLAKYPYIRESRRIEARFTITEQMVASDSNPGMDRAPAMPRSVGVGSYRIDLHPSTSGARTIDTGTLPFQIPLGALLPIQIKNLLPACKNLGVTHITNGCYRLHPVEWNIGEVAGLLAAQSVLKGLPPAAFDEDQRWPEFERVVRDAGVEVAWSEFAEN